MFRNLFDREAPWTVRAGAVCLAVVSVFDFTCSVLNTWADGGLSLGLWRAVYRPLIGLSAGLAWAWGIAHMLGVFYWGWVALIVFAAVVFVVMLILPAIGFGPPLEPHTWTVADGIGLALVVAACVFLLSGPSLRAYWRHGRLSPRKSTEPA